MNSFPDIETQINSAITQLWSNDFNVNTFKELIKSIYSNTADKKGLDVILVSAIRATEVNAVLTLLEYQPDLNSKEILNSPLFSAKYQPKLFKLLLEKGARLKEGEKDELGITHPNLTSIYTMYEEKDTLEISLRTSINNKKVKI